MEETQKQLTPRDLARLFPTGQYGRFYVVSNLEDIDTPFRVQVLPAGEAALPNGKPNLCLNSDAVLVYGQLPMEGRHKSSGWLHQGKWVDDFMEMAFAKKAEIDAMKEAETAAKNERELAAKKRIQELLSMY